MPDKRWLESLFNAIDRKQAGAFTEHLADDCSFTLGNNPTIHGRQGVHEMVSGFFDSIAGLSHEIQQFWKVDDALICHGSVTYSRHDGSELHVPFANVMLLAGPLISDYRIFVDTSQLYLSQ